MKYNAKKMKDNYQFLTTDNAKFKSVSVRLTADLDLETIETTVETRVDGCTTGRWMNEFRTGG